MEMDEARMITVVGWLWRDLHCRTQYAAEHVVTWASMIERNLTIPHRFLVLTDDPKGVRAALSRGKVKNVAVEQLWADGRKIGTPNWPREYPQCWVRLKAFDESMRALAGDRFVSIDLDCVVVGSLNAILSRKEDFLIIRREKIRPADEGNLYQGSMWLMRTGSRARVWREFKGVSSLEQMQRDGADMRYFMTDQGWILYKLGADEAGWTIRDGVFGWPWLEARGMAETPPAIARIVFFQGKEKPWSIAWTKVPGWIRENYR